MPEVGPDQNPLTHPLKGPVWKAGPQYNVKLSEDSLWTSAPPQPLDLRPASLPFIILKAKRGGGTVFANIIVFYVDFAKCTGTDEVRVPWSVCMATSRFICKNHTFVSPYPGTDRGTDRYGQVRIG